MSGEILSSLGTVGEIDINRSEGRAYQTVERVVDSIAQLQSMYRHLEAEAKANGRRRHVLRAECDEATTASIWLAGLPMEACIPLSEINQESRNYVVYLANNVHRSEIPELVSVTEYWNSNNGRMRNPSERVLGLDPGFRLVRSIGEGDQQDLLELWKPFGWEEGQVRSFISTYEANNNLWFSGVRDTRSGCLVAACMGESLRFANVFMVEGTEYSTMPGYEGKGLCAVSVIALYAQVLHDTYYQTGVMPLITAEFDMSSRSDIVGRKVGMHIPLIDLVNEDFPLQVLRRNVSILDRQEPNDLSWRELGDVRHWYRDAYRTKYRYWRNFILGTLPYLNVEQYYSEDTVEMILSNVE